MTPHEVVRPEGLPPAIGYSHGVLAAPGRTLYVAGQIAAGADGSVVGDDFAGQFDLALANVVSVVRAAGGAPGHVTAMTVFTTDIDGYRASVGPVGAVWRRHMGRHFPAMALVAVSALVDPAAMVEVAAVAVLPAEA